MSLINNRNEESTPEFEVISGGKENRSSTSCSNADGSGSS